MPHELRHHSRMLSLEAAQENILHRVGPSGTERVPLAASFGRILAESLPAPIALPPFDNSAMDGYAVLSADLAGAAPDRPVSLRLAGQANAGLPSGSVVTSGCCTRIFTGAPLPEGADAVVMQEDTEPDPNAPGRVRFLSAATPWENVRFRGEDLKAGALVASAGERLNAGRIGLAAALGLESVVVGRRPAVGLLATGSELMEAGTPLRPGCIYESNRTMLAPLVSQAGGIVRVHPIVPDTLAATRSALEHAFAGADVVITSGGVSVGELDFVKQAFTDLGGRLEFWKVAIKPGKPFVFGELGRKFLCGLPGNPVSALVTFQLLVRPALLRWQGATVAVPIPRPVRAGEGFENRGDRRHFVRARLDECGSARPSGIQASHVLGSLAAADGLVDVPPATRIAAGQEVAFIGFEG